MEAAGGCQAAAYVCWGTADGCNASTGSSWLRSGCSGGSCGRSGRVPVHLGRSNGSSPSSDGRSDTKLMLGSGRRSEPVIMHSSASSCLQTVTSSARTCCVACACSASYAAGDGTLLDCIAGASCTSHDRMAAWRTKSSRANGPHATSELRMPADRAAPAGRMDQVRAE